MISQVSKKELADQISNAFSFVQKLYNESSYLIKEIEGQLAESATSFQILRPSGYGINARTSTGLELRSVNLWLMRKFAVAFVENFKGEDTTGQTTTEINDTLKVLYFRIILDEKNQDYPQLHFGVFYDVKKVKVNSYIKKFENLMGYFEYNDTKVFKDFPDIDFEDTLISLKGKFKAVNILDINSSEDLMKSVIEPAISIYHSVE